MRQLLPADRPPSPPASRLARLLTAALALVCLVALGRAVDLVPRTEAFFAYEGLPIGERLAYAANLDFTTQVKTNAAHAATTSVQGFMTAADKTKLNGLPASAATSTRQILTTSPIQGGGDLSADRTLSLNSSALDTTISGLGFVKSAGTSNDVIVDVAALAGTSIGTYTGGGASSISWASMPATIDGQPTALNMKFLLNGGGTTPLDNGVWTITTYTATGAAGAATRTTGFTTGAQLRDARVRVLYGKRRGATYEAAHPVARTIGDATLGKVFFKRIDTKAGPDEVVRWFDDFTSNPGASATQPIPVAGGQIQATASGTGAFVTLDFTASVNAGNVRGAVTMNPGTTATGWAALGSSWSNSTTVAENGDSVALSNDLCFSHEWKAVNRQLSTGTQEFASIVSLAGDRTASMKLFANGIGWVYDRTSAVSSVNWLRAVRAASSGTPVDTGITVNTTTFHTFRIDKYSGDDAVYMYEDGTLVQTVTSGLPTVNIGTMLGSFASVGVNGKTALSLDWIRGEICTPTGRG